MLRNLHRTIRKQLGYYKSRVLREARALSGSVREKEMLGLLVRPHYAYGMLRAADMARLLGHRKVTICEFGVATGNGLLAMIELASLIGAETEIEFRIVGFDTGEGLPELEGYKDHPEIWSKGDFAMINRDELLNRIGGRAELQFGDIKDTMGTFISSLEPEAPLGFLSVDVDIYSASRAALECLTGDARHYLPAISIYFDDVCFFFANRWCGELLSIEEFNTDHNYRKIDIDRGLASRRLEQPAVWHNKMYVAHILDHEFRSGTSERTAKSLEDHLMFMRQFNLI